MKIYLVALSNPGAMPPLEFAMVADGIPGIPSLQSVLDKEAFLVMELHGDPDVVGSVERYARMGEGFSAVELDILQTFMRRAAQTTACVLVRSTDFGDVVISDGMATICQGPRRLEIDPASGGLQTQKAYLLEATDVVTGAKTAEYVARDVGTEDEPCLELRHAKGVRKF